LITLEGPEGGGKTTQTRLLGDRLQDEGYEVVLTREPGGTLLGEAIRTILLKGTPGAISPRAESLLYLAVRAQHAAEVLFPGLQAGKVVICDRFTDSTLAYQGYARHLDIEALIAMNAFATDHLEPDLTLLLDVDPEKGLQRQNEHNGMEAEGLEFHRRVREGFLLLARRWPERIRVVDASQPLEIVRQAIWNIVRDWMGERESR